MKFWSIPISYARHTFDDFWRSNAQINHQHKPLVDSRGNKCWLSINAGDCWGCKLSMCTCINYIYSYIVLYIYFVIIVTIVITIVIVLMSLVLFLWFVCMDWLKKRVCICKMKVFVYMYIYIHGIYLTHTYTSIYIYIHDIYLTHTYTFVCIYIYMHLAKIVCVRCWKTWGIIRASSTGSSSILCPSLPLSSPVFWSAKQMVQNKHFERSGCKAVQI